MRFSLIVEHPDRVRSSPAHLTDGQESEQFVMLDAGCLSDASRLANRLDGGSALLRIRVTEARPAADATEIFLPPRKAAIVSLIHDASLLGIAVGALITGDESSVCPGSMRDGIASDLNGLGYRVRTDPHVELADQSPRERVELPR
jgi:hypothetical protein